MTFSIVPIAPIHIPEFSLAVDSVAKERKFLAFLEGAPLEMSRAFVLENLQLNNPAFVALIGEKVVGWCDLVALKSPVFAHSADLGMGVLASYRGRGIGEALIRATLQRAREVGFVRIELTVLESNKAARALYQKVGFQLEGIKKRGALLNDAYEDVYCMALLFE